MMKASEKASEIIRLKKRIVAERQRYNILEQRYVDLTLNDGAKNSSKNTQLLRIPTKKTNYIISSPSRRGGIIIDSLPNNQIENFSRSKLRDSSKSLSSALSKESSIKLLYSKLQILKGKHNNAIQNSKKLVESINEERRKVCNAVEINRSLVSQKDEASRTFEEIERKFQILGKQNRQIEKELKEKEAQWEANKFAVKKEIAAARRSCITSFKSLKAREYTLKRGIDNNCKVGYYDRKKVDKSCYCKGRNALYSLQKTDEVDNLNDIGSVMIPLASTLYSTEAVSLTLINKGLEILRDNASKRAEEIVRDIEAIKQATHEQDPEKLEKAFLLVEDQCVSYVKLVAFLSEELGDETKLKRYDQQIPIGENTSFSPICSLYQEMNSIFTLLVERKLLKTIKSDLTGINYKCLIKSLVSLEMEIIGLASRQLVLPGGAIIDSNTISVCKDSEKILEIISDAKNVDNDDSNSNLSDYDTAKETNETTILESQREKIEKIEKDNTGEDDFAKQSKLLNSAPWKKTVIRNSNSIPSSSNIFEDKKYEGLIRLFKTKTTSTSSSSSSSVSEETLKMLRAEHTKSISIGAQESKSKDLNEEKEKTFCCVREFPSVKGLLLRNSG